MRLLFKFVAVLFVAIGVFLIYAVINAIGSAGGANVPVCVAYVIAALILGLLARKLWSPRRPARATSAT